MIRLMWEGRPPFSTDLPAAPLRPLHPLALLSQPPSAVEEVCELRGGTAPPTLHPVWNPLTPGTTGFGVPSEVLLGDALEGLRSLGPELRGKVSLIYLDPPFATGKTFFFEEAKSGVKERAYGDRWEAGMKSYLPWLESLLREGRELLSEEGSLFLHVDWRTSGYARILMDEIFGPEAFLNHLIWAYSGGARGAKAKAEQFARNHDDILWYRKGRKHTFTPPALRSLYTPEEARKKGFLQDPEGRWFKTAPRGDYTAESLQRLESEGRLYRTAKGQIRIRYPLDTEGKKVVETQKLGDVWTDISDAMHLPKAEKTGYPTQKPIALLERLLLSSTKPGDIVLDPCSGSGTTAVVAARHGRRSIAVDRSPLAIYSTLRRLLSLPSAPPVALLSSEPTPASFPASDALAQVTATSTLQGRRLTLRLSPLAASSDLDLWGVDFYGHTPFCPSFVALRSSEGGSVSTCASHLYPAPGMYRPKIWLWTKLGQLQTIEMEAQTVE